MMPRLLLTLLLVLVAVPTPRAHAQLDDTAMAARRQLINEAQQAMMRGDHSVALERAESAGAIRMTTSLRRLIATERRELGMLAEALAAAESCVLESMSERDAESLRACRALRAELEPLVGHVLLELPESVASFDVQIAERVVSPELVRFAIAVTPGPVSVAVSAPGHARFESLVEVDAREVERVVVTLERLPEPPTPIAVGEAVVDDPEGVDMQPNTDTIPETALDLDRPSTEGPTGRRVVPWLVVGGVGLAAMAASIAPWRRADSELEALRSACTAASPCPSDVYDEGRNDVERLDRTTNVLLFSGVAVAAVGGTVALVRALAGDDGSHDSFAGVGVDIGPSGANVAAAVHF